MLTDEYTVRLTNFQGPLDLLLFLIRRAEVDVTEVAIAEITEQYLAFLQDIEVIDVDAAGEFLVTAAALLEIKSRLLSPTPDSAEGVERHGRESDHARNPAAELVRQLLEYRRFREVGDQLERRRRQWEMRTPLRPLGASQGSFAAPETAELEDLSLFDLVQAYARVAETVQFERIGDHRIVDDDTPIELYAADVLDKLRRAVEFGSADVTMRDVFADRNRAEVVGLFLAVLELVRQRAVRVDVRRETFEVVISLRAPEEDDRPAPASPAAEAPVAQPVGWDDDDPFEQGDEDDDEPEAQEGDRAH